MVMQQVVADLLVYKVKYSYVVRLYCFAEASRIRHEVPTSHFERKGRGAGRGGRARGELFTTHCTQQAYLLQVHKINLAYTRHLIPRYARPSNLYTTIYEYDTIRPSMRLVKESSHHLQSYSMHTYIHIDSLPHFYALIDLGWLQKLFVFTSVAGIQTFWNSSKTSRQR